MRGTNRHGVLGLLAVLGTADCGGRSQGEQLPSAPNVAGTTSIAGASNTGHGTTAGDTNRATAGAGGSAGAPSPGTAGVSSTLTGCPDASWDRACPAGFAVSLDRNGRGNGQGGVWAEPLQIPDLNFSEYLGYVMIPPELWDRSALPAGACVFRVHGLNTGCLSRSTRISFGGCYARDQVVPFSYYEKGGCDQAIAPGCPTAEPYGDGAWWYAVTDPASTDEVTVVICAPQCALASPDTPLCFSSSR